MRDKQAGFTLIELIAVIVILAVLAVSALNVDVEDDLVTHNEAFKLAADIRYVQSLSMTRADNYSVTLSDVGGTWQYQLFLSATPVTNPATGSSDPVILQSTVTLPAPLSSGTLSFDGRGVPYGDSNTALTATAGVLLVLSGSPNQTVNIKPQTGYVIVV